MLFDRKVCNNKISDYLAVNGYDDYDDGDAYYYNCYYYGDVISRTNWNARSMMMMLRLCRGR